MHRKVQIPIVPAKCTLITGRTCSLEPEGRGFRVCVKTRFECHSEEPQATRNLALPLKTFRAGFLAEFTLSAQSEIPSLRSGQALRCAQDDSEGLGMTA
jgi:hypothetical protein